MEAESSSSGPLLRDCLSFAQCTVSMVLRRPGASRLGSSWASRGDLSASRSPAACAARWLCEPHTVCRSSAAAAAATMESQTCSLSSRDCFCLVVTVRSCAQLSRACLSVKPGQLPLPSHPSSLQLPLCYSLLHIMCLCANCNLPASQSSYHSSSLGSLSP